MDDLIKSDNFHLTEINYNIDDNTNYQYLFKIE